MGLQEFHHVDVVVQRSRGGDDLVEIRWESLDVSERLLKLLGRFKVMKRKDYTDPDDYEYEPTPHDEVLTRAQQHYDEHREDL